jgi:hypothetical protein
MFFDWPKLYTISSSSARLTYPHLVPTFLFGCTPPRDGTDVVKAETACEKFASRSAVLATDGFIVYDIQDEAGRTKMERPFPFRKTLDPSWYGSLFPSRSGKGCMIYKVREGAQWTT